MGPVRALPATFPRRSYLPKKRESAASGSIDPTTFSAGRDLVYVSDDRAWWESDHDTGDTEDDHSMHRRMELPLRRLIEMVSARDGILEVQDAYRASGIHSARSLHREGRGIDLTCDEMPMGELAKLCWAAGFDWVYYEAPKGGGDHIHCSVSRGSPSRADSTDDDDGTVYPGMEEVTDIGARK